MEPIDNMPNYLDFWEGCTGCGSKAVVVSIESSSGDYPHCAECYQKYKKTGFLQCEYKVNRVKIALRNTNPKP